MEYEFFFTDTASIHITNAPRLPDSDLRSIAHMMERDGRYYGSKIRIHTIGIRSDYVPPNTPMRRLQLKENKQNERGAEE